MNARDHITVQQSLETAPAGGRTVFEITRDTGMEEKDVRAELKRMAGQGQIEHIPGRGRVGGRYLLTTTKSSDTPPSAATTEAPSMRLTREAQEDRDDFERAFGKDGNCSCHISPPCNSCVHPGNPLNQAEDEACWEPDVDEEQTAKEDGSQKNTVLLGIIADIRAAIGDPTGEIMLSDLAGEVSTRVEQAEAAAKSAAEDLAACAPFLKPEELPAERIARMHQEVIELLGLLGNERTANAALREQLEAAQDVKDAAAGYLLKVPKRRPRTITKPESARDAALAAAKVTGRAEVFALVPVGKAVRGSEWRGA